MSTDQPFRFLDLPSEVRLMIYGYLFANSALCFPHGSDFPRWTVLAKPATVSTPSNLPAILTTCKTVRQEAEPLFLGSYALVLNRDGLFTSLERRVAKIPSKYRAKVSTVILSAELPDLCLLQEFPHVRNIHVLEQFGPTTIDDEVEIDDLVHDAVKEIQRYCNRGCDDSETYLEVLRCQKFVGLVFHSEWIHISGENSVREAFAVERLSRTLVGRQVIHSEPVYEWPLRMLEGRKGNRH